MRENNFSNEEISLVEIYTFFARQAKTIAIAFLLTFAVGLGYTLTRPVLYTSISSVTSGNSISLSSSILVPLEKPEEITYKYSSTATITPIKNTSIVQVSSTTENQKKSIENVKSTIKEITNSQKRIYQDQEQKLLQYIELLNISDDMKIRALDLLQTASRSSATHSSEIVTTELPFSGKLKTYLFLSFFLAALVSLFVGAIIEAFRRIRETAQSHA
ncbi:MULTISPECIES: hypothetical protein [Pseudomonas]|uniref:hypothetical protein n=1 Tax=Pseudomonas TaxID=286 RepID=UPI001112DB48|nr:MULTISPECIES: hypothetical protein [Pseudomonas putida group]MCL8305700.1 hypothetical protein [Pseudomonas putida]MDD2015362.1 hypothetical protein [Pseudomonas putida]MDD2060971.1 hypothetical protein [Pseudomonas putida]HDS1770194.1 hypothetical protein [Pseudomonas putida]